jgi:anthranilate synthase component 1
MHYTIHPFSKNLSIPHLFQEIRQKFGRPSALLESLHFDEHNKISIIAARPIQEICSGKNSLQKVRSALKKSQKFPDNFPIEKFNGGLIGYFNFEIFGEIEPRGKFTSEKSTDFNALFYEFSFFILIDHSQKNLHVLDFSEETDFLEIFKSVQNTSEASSLNLKQFKTEALADFTKFQSQKNFQEFSKIIADCKQNILDGEIFQIIASNGFRRRVKEKDGLAYYKVLREIEPTTHLFYLDFGEKGQVIGASPEILGSKSGKTVNYAPIAGTRYRGKTEDEEQAIEAELINDPKENAEHDMLVDMGRNDLGKICQPGTIKISREKFIKKYANVMHLVSELEGEIQENFDAIDFFESIFPIGTLTGAPKIRAIELIYQYEKSRRNLYGGSVGYFSHNDNMEHCIAIRSFFLKEDEITFRVGAGIVQDSENKKEWLEIHNKAKTLCKVINYIENQ